MTALRRLYDRAVAGPSYPPNEADLRDVSLFGLAFPLRASIAVLAVTALITADQTGLLRAVWPDAMARVTGVFPTSVTRFVLFLLVPLLIVVIGFRDHPRRYGLRLGDWRWGALLLAVGLVVMTPIILWLSGVEAFRNYYSTGGGPIGFYALNHVLELIPAEFLLRGFLMFTLWRRIGPLALVVSLIPFVLTHVGKPDIELWSTFIGGSIFAWLDWRTGSILWSAIGHVYVLTLMTVVVSSPVL